MDLEHHFTVDAPVETVWATMLDLESVAQCFPGAALSEADGDSFAGTVKVKLGPIALLYKGSGSFTEKDESAHRAVIEAKGRDKRGNGTAGADVVMTMTSEGSGTRVDVRTDLNVTGKPAQFGRGVMQDVSDKLLGQFTDCLAGRFEEPGAEPARAGASAPETPEAAPARGEEAPAAGPTAGESSSAAAPAAPAAAAAASAPAATAAAPAAPGADMSPRAETPPATASSGAGSAQPAGSSDSSGSSGGSGGSGGSGDAIDLGGMLVPGIVRGYLPHAAAGLVGLLIGLRFGWKMGRWVGRHSKKNRQSPN